MNKNFELELSVGEFVGLLNQTLEFAYPSVVIRGELANFRVSKNRWVYFDLKDEEATVHFFGTIYQLPGPLEDGMLLRVKGTPRLHPQYGFSITIQQIRPAGEGSIKKAAALLQAKLEAEGLFDPTRKRALPYPPKRIGLITSGESAAYRDFVKILAARWGGVEICHVDIQVQGDAAPQQVIEAIRQCNQMTPAPDVLVITRGGGSAEDLQTFSAEQVTRAVALSRIPTLVAIGHEVDVSLAELAADRRASTPSNAAEMLTPDRQHVIPQIIEKQKQLTYLIEAQVKAEKQMFKDYKKAFTDLVISIFERTKHSLTARKQLLAVLDPQAALQRGYAIVHKGKEIIRSGKQLAVTDNLQISLIDAQVQVAVKQINMKGMKNE